jgi:hypothetical protein
VSFDFLDINNMANSFGVLPVDGETLPWDMPVKKEKPAKEKPVKKVGLGVFPLFLAYLFLRWNATEEQIVRLAKAFGVVPKTDCDQSQESSTPNRRQKANPQGVSKRHLEIAQEQEERRKKTAFETLCNAVDVKLGEVFGKAFSVARGIVPDVSQFLLTDANGTTFLVVESKRNGRISMFHESDHIFWNPTSRGYCLVHVVIGRDGQMSARPIYWSWICAKAIQTYEVGNSVIDFSPKEGASSTSDRLSDWNIFLHHVEEVDVDEKIPASETPVSDDEDPTN